MNSFNFQVHLWPEYCLWQGILFLHGRPFWKLVSLSDGDDFCISVILILVHTRVMDFPSHLKKWRLKTSSKDISWDHLRWEGDGCFFHFLIIVGGLGELTLRLLNKKIYILHFMATLFLTSHGCSYQPLLHVISSNHPYLKSLCPLFTSPTISRHQEMERFVLGSVIYPCFQEVGFYHPSLVGLYPDNFMS